MTARLLYPDAAAYREAPRKAVALIGMSGVGKTSTAQTLRATGDWFHYSVDYRIGTRYLGERIVDEFKRAAMKVPMLRELLISDSIYIASNITFENLTPLSAYLGKPGDPDRGGLSMEDYVQRQAHHRDAEFNALLDATEFIDKARDIYGYAHFLCDTGGSIAEVVDPRDDTDVVLTQMAERMLLVYIRETDAMVSELERRFARNPKPMYYDAAFLARIWAEYLQIHGLSETEVDPDAFIRWGFRRLIDRRRPLYQEIADRWGVTVPAEEVADIETAADFDAMIVRALSR
jgi:hypothetical protein